MYRFQPAHISLVHTREDVSSPSDTDLIVDELLAAIIFLEHGEEENHIRVLAFVIKPSILE